ncbi:hypothetical protein EYF80_063001 [Liparis tanakae]|uniref:Uncharacterized protein n=1 Tax=Liparis tanakae TaxID=230148 RepID=A0A4Z2ED72_9TELE|nr:hypothetical protein EYF80_063001 [Liparis tanakae]
MKRTEALIHQLPTTSHLSGAGTKSSGGGEHKPFCQLDPLPEETRLYICSAPSLSARHSERT